MEVIIEETVNRVIESGFSCSFRRLSPSLHAPAKGENMVFYKCMGCGNFVTFLTEKTACTPTCCGKPMTELIANTTDAAQEKHVPSVSKNGSTFTVQVGSVAHPMTEEHYIQFIVLETKNGFQKKDLKPGDAPEAVFELAEGEEAVCVYAYCNLHGLWKSEI